MDLSDGYSVSSHKQAIFYAKYAKVSINISQNGPINSTKFAQSSLFFSLNFSLITIMVEF